MIPILASDSAFVKIAVSKRQSIIHCGLWVVHLADSAVERQNLGTIACHE